MENEQTVTFAVSCLSEGLLRVDGARVERLDRVPTAGLALSSHGDARARHSPSETASAGEVLLGDRTLEVAGLLDPHELAWDGQLLAGVATLANAVRWFDQRGRVVRSWQAPGAGDCWHLNGIAVGGGRTAVTAFGRFARHRDWAETPRAGAGLVLEASSGRVLRDGLSSPHSPRFVDGALAVCDSGRGELVVGGRKVGIGGWTRGLAVTDLLFAVGVSARRGEAGCAELALVRRADLQVVRRIPLPVREVFDVVELTPARARCLARPAVSPPAMARLRTSDLEAGIAAPARLRLRRGSLGEVPCTVTNRGDAVLRSAPPYPVEIVAEWASGDRALWSPLPEPLEPGCSIELPVRLLAPRRPGPDILELRLVQAGVAWFEGRARVEVTVA